jgi:hypothetical protein
MSNFTERAATKKEAASSESQRKIFRTPQRSLKLLLEQGGFTALQLLERGHREGRRMVSSQMLRA